MRPVLLEMAGFGSFREPTTVDFVGADYFALVGPTGSGKSTVIDAMTFALYGSVPRWDNARTVALALAPTIARGTVRFVFDVAGRAGGTERYVVARELRRAASGGVSVRTARLERLRDPGGTGVAAEETEPVADGAAATTKAVEELLGLPFGDFTTCVVLPQGEFAEFLHTEPRKRQETLVRLLGLGVYDAIAKEANAEARSQEQRAQVLTEQLVGYAEDTAAAEQAAEERITALAGVRTRVDGAMPVLAAVTAALAEAEATMRRLSVERSQLVGVAAPAGLRELAGRRASAAAASTEAKVTLGAAETADTAAREAVAAAPARGPLEQARRHHAERASIAAELPVPATARPRPVSPRPPPDRTPQRPGPRSKRRASRGMRRRPRWPRRGTSAAGSGRSGTPSRRSSRPLVLTRSKGGGRAPLPRAIGPWRHWPPRSAPTSTRATPSRRRPTVLRSSRPGGIIARSSTPAPCTAGHARQRMPREPPSPRPRPASRNRRRTPSTPGLGVRRACAPISPPRCGPAWRRGRSAPSAPSRPGPARAVPEDVTARLNARSRPRSLALDEARRREATATADRLGPPRPTGGRRHGGATDGAPAAVVCPRTARRARRAISRHRAGCAAPRDGARRGGRTAPPSAEVIGPRSAHLERPRHGGPGSGRGRAARRAGAGRRDRRKSRPCARRPRARGYRAAATAA